MRTLYALAASVGLIGCVGGIDEATDDPSPGGVGGGGSGDAAKEAKLLFETQVFPIIQGKCAGCHTEGRPQGNITGFVGESLQTAYATATGYQALIGDWTPTGAPILLKITGDAKTAAHQPITYDDAQQARITEWLAAEIDARGGGTGGGTGGAESAGQVSKRLLDEWSSCMTVENFETADMREWGRTGSDEGDCDRCHNITEQGYVASRQTSPYFFETITQDRLYLLQYFTIDFSGGLAAAKVIPNERTFEGVGRGLPPHQTHPEFDPENARGMPALQAFYNSTMSATTAAGGPCGPTKLLN